MENWTIQHAANAWKSGSHQIHFDDKSKLELLKKMCVIVFPELTGIENVGSFEYYYVFDYEKRSIRFSSSAFDLPIIPISQINNDFKWGEEVEVSLAFDFSISEIGSFIGKTKDGRFTVEDKYGNVRVFNQCRRPIKEQPIYTKGDFDETVNLMNEHLEKLNKICNHFRDRL